jgi:hypothetical protein
MLIGCSVSYSLGDCVAVVSCTSVACSLSSTSACVAVSSSLSVACPCGFNFVRRLLSYSDSVRSYNSPPSSSSSSMYSPSAFRLLFLILFRRLHRCGFHFVYRLLTFSFACVAVSPSFSDVLLPLPLPLCLSFALFLFRSLLQFIAKPIVVFNVFAQSNPTTTTTRTPTTYRPTRTPTKQSARTPTSRRKGTPTSRWKGTPTNPQTRPPYQTVACSIARHSGAQQIVVCSIARHKRADT